MTGMHQHSGICFARHQQLMVACLRLRIASVTSPRAAELETSKFNVDRLHDPVALDSGRTILLIVNLSVLLRGALTVHSSFTTKSSRRDTSPPLLTVWYPNTLPLLLNEKTSHRNIQVRTNLSNRGETISPTNACKRSEAPRLGAFLAESFIVPSPASVDLILPSYGNPWNRRHFPESGRSSARRAN